MFSCHVCGSTEAKKEYINEIFQIDNKPVLVENIPAMVCVRCGEETFSRETTERIRPSSFSKSLATNNLSYIILNQSE